MLLYMAWFLKVKVFIMVFVMLFKVFVMVEIGFIYFFLVGVNKIRVSVFRNKMDVLIR